MKKDLEDFIQSETFPCIMAKVVAKKGLLKVQTIEEPIDSNSSIKILKNMYEFLDKYRQSPERLSSFALVLKNEKYFNFNLFEDMFWKILNSLHREDKKKHPYDQRVSSNPQHENFSFSLKTEAFFIIALHPHSPRWARRFKYPAIVFNPHAQFEALRSKGIFKKIRDTIRLKDKYLQGFINPMLTDFGEKSEVFQYMGRIYDPNATIPLDI